MLLVAVFGIAIAAAIVITRRAARRPIAVAPNADLVPLDYADDDLRRTLDQYDTFALGRGLDPIAPSCARGSPETYRLVLFPGISGGDFVAFDVTAGGSQARVEQREFNVRDSGAWQLTHTRKLERRELDALRDEATRWLLSGKPASPGALYLDVSEWYFEMCRRGRYHFAARYSPEAHPDSNREFLAVAHALQSLRHDSLRK